MTLGILIDENLSESLIPLLEPMFDRVEHARLSHGSGRSDRSILDRAATEGLMILTRDDDFDGLAVSSGSSVKVIRVASHNPTTSQVAAMIKQAGNRIECFASDPEARILILGSRSDCSL